MYFSAETVPVLTPSPFPRGCEFVVLKMSVQSFDWQWWTGIIKCDTGLQTATEAVNQLGKGAKLEAPSHLLLGLVVQGLRGRASVLLSEGRWFPWCTCRSVFVQDTEPQTAPCMAAIAIGVWTDYSKSLWTKVYLKVNVSCSGQTCLSIFENSLLISFSARSDY